MGDPACYVCMDADGELVSPCPCRGTGGRVHPVCLKDAFEARQSWLDLRCPTCKHVYRGAVAVELATLAAARVGELFGGEGGEMAHALANQANAMGDVEGGSLHAEAARAFGGAAGARVERK